MPSRRRVHLHSYGLAQFSVGFSRSFWRQLIRATNDFYDSIIGRARLPCLISCGTTPSTPPTRCVGGLENGIGLAELVFDALITTDQNLRYQQTALAADVRLSSFRPPAG